MKKVKLLKDLPNLKAGNILKQTPYSAYYGIENDDMGKHFAVVNETVESKKEWFEPISTDDKTIHPTYILLKDLPDAKAGTRIVWDSTAQGYYYTKIYPIHSCFRNILSIQQVSNNPEWFKKEEKEVTFTQEQIDKIHDWMFRVAITQDFFKNVPIIDIQNHFKQFITT